MTNFVKEVRVELFKQIQQTETCASHALDDMRKAWSERLIAAASARVEIFDRCLADIFVMKMFLDYLSPAGAAIPDDETAAIAIYNYAINRMDEELASLELSRDDFGYLGHVNHLIDSCERFNTQAKLNRDDYLALRVGREDWDVDTMLSLIRFERQLDGQSPSSRGIFRKKAKTAGIDVANEAHKAAATHGESLLRKPSAPKGSESLRGMKPAGFA